MMEMTSGELLELLLIHFCSSLDTDAVDFYKGTDSETRFCSEDSASLT